MISLVFLGINSLFFAQMRETKSFCLHFCTFVPHLSFTYKAG